MIKKILIISFSLIFALFISEIIIRKIFGFKAQVRITSKGDPLGKGSMFKISNDEVLIYELRHPYWEKISRIKTPNEYRIICIGDSITYPSHVDFEHSYPELLEKLLNERYDKSFTIINADVPGYNTIQELHLFKTQLIKYNPDLIIVGYCAANDRTIRRKIIRYKDSLYCSDIEERYPYVIKFPFGNMLLKKSAFYRFINYILSEYCLKSGKVDKVKYLDMSNKTEEAIREFKIITRKKC